MNQWINLKGRHMTVSLFKSRYIIISVIWVSVRLIVCYVNTDLYAVRSKFLRHCSICLGLLLTWNCASPEYCFRQCNSLTIVIVKSLGMGSTIKEKIFVTKNVKCPHSKERSSTLIVFYVNILIYIKTNYKYSTFHSTVQSVEGRR